jgi:hypothetical protein
MARDVSKEVKDAFKASGLKTTRSPANPGDGGVYDRRTVGTMGSKLITDSDGGLSAKLAKPTAKRK